MQCGTKVKHTIFQTIFFSDQNRPGAARSTNRGTQRIVSVSYHLGRPLTMIPSDFLRESLSPRAFVI